MFALACGHYGTNDLIVENVSLISYYLCLGFIKQMFDVLNFSVNITFNRNENFGELKLRFRKPLDIANTII